MRDVLALQLSGAHTEARTRAKPTVGVVERERGLTPTLTLEHCPPLTAGLPRAQFCNDAKKALDTLGAMYTVVEFDEAEDGYAMKVELSQITGRSSAPQVFVGGQFVGGCNDGGLGGVIPLNKSGKLADMLIAAGALSPTQRI